MCSAFLCAALLVIPLGAASSQSVQLGRGDLIRLTFQFNPLDNQIGHVLVVRGDTLFLQVAPAETLAVALADVNQLDVSTGRRRYALRGAGIGSLVGGGLGAVMGYASGDDRGWCCFSAGGKAIIYGVGLGVTGLVIGAIAGSLHVTDRWTSVPLGSAEATPRLQVGRGHARLAVTVSF
jgi:hypothetical protein